LIVVTDMTKRRWWKA